MTLCPARNPVIAPSRNGGRRPQAGVAVECEGPRQVSEATFADRQHGHVWNAAEPDEAFIWATHGGAELDLLLLKDGQPAGIECKRADAPRLTPAMTTAMKDLHLETLYVVYPGSRRYPLAQGIEVVPLSVVAD